MGLWDRDYMRRRPSPSVEAAVGVEGTGTPRPNPVRRGFGGACFAALLLQAVALAAPWLALDDAGGLRFSWARTWALIEASRGWVLVFAAVLAVGWGLMVLRPSRLSYAFAGVLGAVPVLGLALEGVPRGVWDEWVVELGWAPSQHAATGWWRPIHLAGPRRERSRNNPG
jgi:hypothetical protein